MEGDAGYQCRQDGCYTLGYGLPPSPTPSTGHLMRGLLPRTAGAMEAWHIKSFCILPLWGYMGCGACPQHGQQWILRMNGPETHMALSFPLSGAVSNE